jgi:hypothetical protein
MIPLCFHKITGGIWNQKSGRNAGLKVQLFASFFVENLFAAWLANTGNNKSGQSTSVPTILLPESFEFSSSALISFRIAAVYLGHIDYHITKVLLYQYCELWTRPYIHQCVDILTACYRLYSHRC